MATAGPEQVIEPLTSTDGMRMATAASRAAWNRQLWGTRIAGAAALALGAIGLIRGDFTIVWLPRLVAEPSAAVPWAGNAINLALIGAVLALGDLLARRDQA